MRRPSVWEAESIRVVNRTLDFQKKYLPFRAHISWNCDFDRAFNTIPFQLNIKLHRVKSPKQHHGFQYRQSILSFCIRLSSRVQVDTSCQHQKLVSGPRSRWDGKATPSNEEKTSSAVRSRSLCLDAPSVWNREPAIHGKRRRIFVMLARRAASKLMDSDWRLSLKGGLQPQSTRPCGAVMRNQLNFQKCTTVDFRCLV